MLPHTQKATLFLILLWTFEQMLYLLLSHMLYSPCLVLGKNLGRSCNASLNSFSHHLMTELLALDIAMGGKINVYDDLKDQL